MASASRVATSFTDRSSPLPMLNTPPAAFGWSSARTKARATSFTWTKSRRCSPSSKIDRRFAVVDAGREDRQDAGVGVRERLARAVGVPQSQGHAFHAVGRSQRQGQPLLRELGDGVDRSERRPLPLGRWNRLHRLAVGIERIPRGVGRGSLGLRSTSSWMTSWESR